MNLFKHIRFSPGHSYKLYCDNTQTLRLLTAPTPKLNTRLRHVDIHHHWLRQEVQAGRLKVEYMSTRDMPADGLTKMLPRQRHELFIKQLNLEDMGSLKND